MVDFFQFFNLIHRAENACVRRNVFQKILYAENLVIPEWQRFRRIVPLENTRVVDSREKLAIVSRQRRQLARDPRGWNIETLYHVRWTDDEIFQYPFRMKIVVKLAESPLENDAAHLFWKNRCPLSAFFGEQGHSMPVPDQPPRQSGD